MNKSELVKAISEKSGSTIRNTEKFLDSFVETINEAMKKGDDVTLVGFGTFSVTERAERIGRNFKTGKNIQIPASKSVKFKAVKALKNSLN